MEGHHRPGKYLCCPNGELVQARMSPQLPWNTAGFAYYLLRQPSKSYYHPLSYAPKISRILWTKIPIDRSNTFGQVSLDARSQPPLLLAATVRLDEYHSTRGFLWSKVSKQLEELLKLPTKTMQPMQGEKCFVFL